MRAAIVRLRRDPGLAALVLALVAVTILYAPTLGRGLVDYDDTYLIADNWILQHPSWASLHTIFFDLASPNRFTLSPEYLPVRDLSIMLDAWIWGTWYPGFHLTNLGLYLAAIVIWFVVLDAFGIERPIAGLAVLVWALHPSHAESVAWLAERKGLLAAMFSGVAALGYARFRTGRSPVWLALGALAAVAAVWSKAPAAFALAGLAALELALPAHRISGKRALLGLAVIGAVSIAAFVPVLVLASSSSVVGTSAQTGRAAMVLGVYGFYMKLGAMEIRNAVAYPIGSDGPSTFEIVIGALGLLATLGLLFAPRGRRWSPPEAVRAGLAFWLVNWLPISHLLLPLQMVVVADRYLLLPSLGIALAFAAAVSRIGTMRGRRALIAVVLLAAALRTFEAQSTWRDAQTLWERAVASDPHDGVAWSAYAEAFTKAGDHPGAADVTARGLQQSRAPRLLLRKALVLLQNGKRDTGMVAMRQAAEAGEPRAMSNYALLLLEDRRIPEALEWARRGAAEMPMYAPATRALGRVAIAGAHPEEAAGAFQRAYELEPTSCVNRYNLALALIQLHRGAEARAHLDACLSDPAVGAPARAALGALNPAPGP